MVSDVIVVVVIVEGVEETEVVVVAEVVVEKRYLVRKELNSLAMTFPVEITLLLSGFKLNGLES